eukprot:1156858-Pelagomonas_calceolata.AAC.7
MLWLTKAYALPASMYAYHWFASDLANLKQNYLKGAKMNCPLQTVQLCLLKRTLGANRLDKCNTFTQCARSGQHIVIRKYRHEEGTEEHTSGCHGDRCDQGRLLLVVGLQDKKHAMHVLLQLSCPRRQEQTNETYHFFLNSWLFFVSLEHLSRPSSQTTWLKIKSHQGIPKVGLSKD